MWDETHDQQAQLERWHREHYFRKLPLVGVLLLAWLWGLVVGIIIVKVCK